MQEQNISVATMARKINHYRSGIYDMWQRDTFEVGLLADISRVTGRNYLLELGLELEEELQEIRKQRELIRSMRQNPRI